MSEAWRYDEVESSPSFPWPPAEGGSVPGGFGETWKSASLGPVAFFRQIPRDGGTGAAVLYYLVVGILVAGATLFWEALGTGARFGDEVVADGAGVRPAVTFLLSPIILILALGLAAGVTHLVLLLLRGAGHGMDTTVRVFCYAYSPMILGIVPVVGTIAGTLWMIVIAIVGLREAHGTETWKPAVAILFPFLLLMGLAAFALMTVLAGAALLG
jgi:hypothetical protein